MNPKHTLENITAVLEEDMNMRSHPVDADAGKYQAKGIKRFTERFHSA